MEEHVKTIAETDKARKRFNFDSIFIFFLVERHSSRTSDYRFGSVLEFRVAPDSFSCRNGIHVPRQDSGDVN
jgi:hypothetical protein